MNRLLLRTYFDQEQYDDTFFISEQHIYCSARLKAFVETIGIYGICGQATFDFIPIGFARLHMGNSQLHTLQPGIEKLLLLTAPLYVDFHRIEVLQRPAVKELCFVLNDVK